MKRTWIALILAAMGLVGCDHDGEVGMREAEDSNIGITNTIDPENVDIPGGHPETDIDSTVDDLQDIVTLV